MQQRSCSSGLGSRATSAVTGTERRSEVNKIRSLFYAWARVLGDVNAFRSPKKMARRIKNKAIGRSIFRKLMK